MIPHFGDILHHVLFVNQQTFNIFEANFMLYKLHIYRNLRLHGTDMVCSTVNQEQLFFKLMFLILHTDPMKLKYPRRARGIACNFLEFQFTQSISLGYLS